MIRVIRNTKTNRVVALKVNGKQFSVSKDLGHALAQEEEFNIKESNLMVKKAKEIEQSLKDYCYVTESKRLKLKIHFDSLNRIVSKDTAIEFKESLSQSFKEKFFEVIEDFILAVNIAQYKKHQDYKKKITQLGIQENKKSA